MYELFKIKDFLENLDFELKFIYISLFYLIYIQ